MRRTLLLLLSALIGCSTPGVAPGPDGGGGGEDAALADDAATTDAGSRDAGPPPITLGTADRPARLIMPPAHDGTTRLPLLVLLHGYTASGVVQDAYLRMSAIARARGFYLVTPDGTVDAMGNRFWNAQPACCDFYGTGVDDVGYLTTLLDQAEERLPIDPTRVYFFGHSNGGFMSYRMACEISDRVTGIGVLAAGDFPDETDCVPTRPVSVLHMHGTLDTTIAYETQPAYASAVDSTERWATRAGCDLSMRTTEGPFDLDTAVAGAETTVTSYAAGCTGAEVTLYTMEGSGHIPGLPQASVERAVDWLLARSAPAL